MRDEVIIRKLVADGEGTAEERRFQLLLNSIRNMRNTTSSASEAAKCLRQIELMELSLKKQAFVAECCKEQSEDYQKQSEKIDEELLTSRQLMDAAKSELVAARQVRKNRQEYAGMVRLIEEVPSRKDTTTKLEEIAEDLKNQHERQRLLEIKLAERRNHLHAFNTILENFEKFIEYDDEIFADAEDSVDSRNSPHDSAYE